jgi:formyltetrahydrofolate-dependent phosphoribosylglycinamide formyltransferase
MIFLIVGCGGRENIICSKLSNNINDIYCIGQWINPDIEIMCKDYKKCELTEDNILNYCKEIIPNIIVIGPETILDTNFVKKCNELGLNCIGPTPDLAQLETSKAFTRNFLNEIGMKKYNPYYCNMVSGYNISNIEFKDDIVIKLDGLAGGKGVFVQGDHFNSHEEGLIIANKFILDSNIVIEEKLEGHEFSLFTLSDGTNYAHLPPVQDYKRAYENNEGPNTGGMGSIIDDFNFIDYDDIQICKYINENVLTKIKDKFNEPYIGILYGSFMKTYDGKIKVIEFNCRFGDSEVFNILNIIENDLSDIFNHMIKGTLNKVDITIKHKYNIVKYLVPKGYPNNPNKCYINYTSNIENAYCASLEKVDDKYKLLGSRAIAVYGEGNTLYDANVNCEKTIRLIINMQEEYDVLFWRKDIGIPIQNDPYKNAGVNIDAGNNFVKLIKNNVESTYNSNVKGKHGNFGGEFNFYDKTLVASTDGVGTKSILVKKYNGNYYTCGHDIVNHSVNDILVQGATPLFFLDYIASSKLNINDSASFVNGCCDACKKVNCVLIGGETAEMPDVYNEGHMDMVGTIIGEKIIHMDGVSEGDLAIGLPSSGPQTNGYTLIREILKKNMPPGNILNTLLKPHGSFLKDVLHFHKNFKITGMCHITGGGLTENLKRTIPNDCTIDLKNITYPNWCNWLKENGDISDENMQKIFNCGIGFIVFLKNDIHTFNNTMFHKYNNISHKLRIAVLSSTNGTYLHKLHKDSNIEITIGLTNKKNCGFISKCNDLEISNILLEKNKNENRDEYDERINSILKNMNIDMILCIGWMRIFSKSFTQKWKNRCFNVHPSLLPAFAGGMDLNVHEEVLKADCDETGCTVHEIDEGIDTGKIIIQKKCKVYYNDTPKSLKQRVQELEVSSLNETIQLFYDNKIGPNVINNNPNNYINLGYVSKI